MIFFRTTMQHQSQLSKLVSLSQHLTLSCREYEGCAFLNLVYSYVLHVVLNNNHAKFHSNISTRTPRGVVGTPVPVRLQSCMLCRYLCMWTVLLALLHHCDITMPFIIKQLQKFNQFIFLHSRLKMGKIIQCKFYKIILLEMYPHKKNSFQMKITR